LLLRRFLTPRLPALRCWSRIRSLYVGGGHTLLPAESLSLTLIVSVVCFPMVTFYWVWFDKALGEAAEIERRHLPTLSMYSKRPLPITICRWE